MHPFPDRSENGRDGSHPGKEAGGQDYQIHPDMIFSCMFRCYKPGDIVIAQKRINKRGAMNDSHIDKPWETYETG